VTVMAASLRLLFLAAGRVANRAPDRLLGTD
jgi:hypothetical protein